MFAGVAIVREAVVTIDADFCILMDASVSIGPDNVAGLDDEERRRESAGSIRSRSVDRVCAFVASASRSPVGQQTLLAVAFSVEQAPCRKAGSLPLRTSWDSALPGHHRRPLRLAKEQRR